MKGKKLILNFEPDTKIPFCYDTNYAVATAVYSAIDKENPKMARESHGAKKQRRYVVSNLLPGGKKTFDENGILADRFVLLIASRDEDLLKTIEDGFKSGSTITVDKIELKLHSSTLTSIYPPAPPAELVTRSPIALEVNDRFIRPDDKRYIEKLIESIKRKYTAITKEPCPEIAIPRIIEFKQKVIMIKKGPIPCTHMRFYIDAPESVISNIMTDGLGSKNALGFGFVDEARRRGGAD